MRESWSELRNGRNGCRLYPFYAVQISLIHRERTTRILRGGNRGEIDSQRLKGKVKLEFFLTKCAENSEGEDMVPFSES